VTDADEIEAEMVVELPSDGTFEGCLRLVEVPDPRGQIDVLSRSGVRHPGQHRASALEQPIRRLAIGEDPRQEPVLPCLGDLCRDVLARDALRSGSCCGGLDRLGDRGPAGVRGVRHR